MTSKAVLIYFLFLLIACAPQHVSHQYNGEKVTSDKTRIEHDGLVSLGADYYKDAQKVYIKGSTRHGILYQNQTFYVKEIKEADPATFMRVGTSYYFSKDKNKVFFIDKTIPRAHPLTFECLGGDQSPYARDHNLAYYRERGFNVDIDSFQVVGSPYIGAGSHYAKDKYSGYHENKKIAGSHGPTFVSIDSYKAKDKNFMYNMGEKIEGLDVSSHISIKPKGYSKVSSYSKDKRFVYYRFKKIQGSHSPSFRILVFNENCAEHALDHKQVYFGGTIIKGADPKTFKVINCISARDSKHTYNYFRKK